MGILYENIQILFIIYGIIGVLAINIEGNSTKKKMTATKKFCNKKKSYRKI
jgi:hypothetical protein